VNADDPYVRGVAGAFAGTRVAFGDAGEVRARDVVDGSTRHARYRRRVGARAPGIAGRHNVANAPQ
jgi:hypothetical protein